MCACVSVTDTKVALKMGLDFLALKRLDHLAEMIIESDLLRALDVTTLIDEFAHEKS